jgi:hypothetical protein
MTTQNNSLRLRGGVTDPVILLISRGAVDTCDVERVFKHSIRFLMASREDVILYRQQVSIVFEGWDEDPRELVDVPEVRSFVKRMAARWPEWAYFFNQQDAIIHLWLSCLVGKSFPGAGAVEIDVNLLKKELVNAFNGMNAMHLLHGLSEKDLEVQSLGLVEVIQQMGSITPP